MDHGDVEHREHRKVVDGELFEPRGDPAVLFEPPDTSLDDVPLSIKVSVEAFVADFVPTRRNNILDAPLGKPSTDRLGGVTLITGDRDRDKAFWAGRRHRCFEEARFVALAGAQDRA